MTIYSLILIIFWFVFIAYWLISGLSAKKSVSNIWRWLGFRVVAVVIIIVLFKLKLIGWADQINFVARGNPTENLLGVILAGTGIAFAVWARFNLGKNWGMPMTVKKDPELITSGPYKYVRHPIYTGIILAILGSALVSGPGWIVVFVLASIYFIYSATQEEKQMLKQFPNQYPEYKKRTKMLIPFVF